MRNKPRRTAPQHIEKVIEGAGELDSRMRRRTTNDLRGDLKGEEHLEVAQSLYQIMTNARLALLRMGHDLDIPNRGERKP